jgi:hypothetical protein
MTQSASRVVTAQAKYGFDMGFALTPHSRIGQGLNMKRILALPPAVNFSLDSINGPSAIKP